MKRHRSLWAYLEDEYHRESYVGHSPGHARDCYECNVIVRVVLRAGYRPKMGAGS